MRGRRPPGTFVCSSPPGCSVTTGRGAPASTIWIAGASSWYGIGWRGFRKDRDTVMIFGAHAIVYSNDATADRACFRDGLGLAAIDAGHGWLIFALPPAEVAVHPAEENDRHDLYFMCGDLQTEISTLAQKGVSCS